jgi:hypothetical protein
VAAPQCTLADLAAKKLPRWQLATAAEIAAARGLIALAPDEIITRSPLEDAFLKLCEGLPAPRVNAIVEGLEVEGSPVHPPPGARSARAREGGPAQRA